MINVNPNINSVLPKNTVNGAGGTLQKTAGGNGGFADTVKAAQSELGKVDALQQAALPWPGGDR